MSQGPVILPGVYDAVTAKAAARAGAKGLYLSGAGVTNSQLGVPDIGLITLTEMARQAAYVCEASGLPVLSDADTGFGEVHNVARTVREMERVGIAGVHLEDQENPKRCGHLEGKHVVEPQDMVRKLRAAIQTRADRDFLIVARTDARAVEGLASAIDRAKRYVDAGADAVFPEALETEAEFAAFRQAVDVPLLANMTEFGKTPLISAARFAHLGYDVVIFPLTAFRVMLKAVTEAYDELMRHGTQAGLIDRMWTRRDIYDLLAYKTYEELDRGWAEGTDGDATSEETK